MPPNLFYLLILLYDARPKKRNKAKNLNGVVNLAPSTLNEPFISRIFKTIWELKKKGRAAAALRGISKKLKRLSRETNRIR